MISLCLTEVSHGTGCSHAWKALQDVAGERNRKVELRLCRQLPSENVEAKYETASNKEKENKTNCILTGGSKHCVSCKNWFFPQNECYITGKIFFFPTNLFDRRVSAA